MEATKAKLLDFLRNSPQFVIPIYQRTYSWTDRQCRQLWNDILRAGKNEKVSAHFLGSIVYVEKGLYSVTAHKPLLVIDGQQRLTTVSLLLLALSEVLGETEPIEGFTARKIRNYYLLNTEEAEEKYFKLILSQTDKDSLIALLKGKPLPKNHSLRIQENHSLFKALLEEHQDRLADVCRGLAKLMVVDISLDREQDNPQLIFESMNSTGLELSQADLIRNYILMGLEPVLQTQLYTDHWRPMELDFGQRAYSEQFDDFMRHYLTLKTGLIPRIDHVYRAFKRYAQTPEVEAAGVEAMVVDIRTHADYFCAMALDAETHPELKVAFRDLRELKVDVAYPFLLELYRDFKAGLLTPSELASAVRLVESYVFRRAVCEIPTNSMNKTFATMGRSIKKEKYLESIKASFQLLPSYRRFPDDEEFQRAIQERDLYNFRSRSYWLRRMENHGRKERISLEEYTVEHILPQCDNDAGKVPQAWRTELGSDWERIWKKFRHTLGNLTLTGYNSEYSNRPFPEKRDMAGGFSVSPLHMNEGLGARATWDESAILDRAQNLAKKAVTVWRPSDLPQDLLEAYKPKAAPSEYTVDDHKHLAAGPVRDLFEAFRKQVLALDPCITEEFLKKYVAYKAETNFVDAEAQATGLKLILNMEIHEVDDSRKICRDVTNKGHYGNGDVEVRLKREEDLPYVLGLVRQAFERQMATVGES